MSRVLNLGRSGKSGLRGRAPADTTWSALERLARELPLTEEGRQGRLVLEAVLEALGADAAYLSEGKPGEVAGAMRLTAAWRRDFLAQVLGQEDEAAGRAVQSYLDPAAKPLSPWPCSAALVRATPAAEGWLVILSFHPRRLFGQTDLEVMALSRRLWLSARQQALATAQWRAALERCRRDLEMVRKV